MMIASVQFALLMVLAFDMAMASEPVSLDYGSFQGFSSASNTESFLGIPFAQPPVEDLRFNKPVPPSYLGPGVNNATSYANACPQMPYNPPGQNFPSDHPGLCGALPYVMQFIPRSIVPDSEDCLYINVVRPTGVSSGADLPVVVWIYGGGFTLGDASAYNGTDIVGRSGELNTPIIYVSFNYRLNVFGFLGGKEVQEAELGNLGLYDQRMALEWVQKYIAVFGGDPEKVIVWGESAGAISIMSQMVAYDGNVAGLFRGAVMLSGSAFPLHHIASALPQDNYDFIVAQTNCSTESATLSCLRQAPYEALMDAMFQTPYLTSYQSLNMTWAPLVDGDILKHTLQESLRMGKYATVPAIFGDVDDEATMFSLYSLNVTTNEQFLDYIETVFLVGFGGSEVDRVAKLYADDPTQGSPFDVGMADTVTPQYKRIAAFLGDMYFQAPRRYALSIMSATQSVWGFLWKRNKHVPGLGSFHASDLRAFYNLTGTFDWAGFDAIINFASTLDPNAPEAGRSSEAQTSLLMSDAKWPRWTPDRPELLTFEYPNALTLSNDTFREKAIAYLTYLSNQMGL